MKKIKTIPAESKRIFPLYFHFGVLIKPGEYDAAKAHYSALYNVRFADSRANEVYLDYPNNPTLSGITHMHATYARTGPPYMELIRAVEDKKGNPPGVLSPIYTNQIYYIGIWSKDLDQEMKTLKAQGIEVEAILRLPDTTKKNPSKKEIDSWKKLAFFTKPDKLGFRREYVDIGERLEVEEWVETGQPLEA